MARPTTTTIDDLLYRYFELHDAATVFIRKLKKTANPDARKKLLRELRRTDAMRAEILDEIEKSQQVN